ncbi:MAG TPA: molybdopterin-dependent oxidoreductase [Actinomycetota bacterium]|nr:molybdopterin-dependent oxidoreductase [Actinomycetota bacterium]
MSRRVANRRRNTPPPPKPEPKPVGPAEDRAGPGAGAIAGLASAAAALAISAVAHTLIPSIPFPPVAVAEAVIRGAPGKVDAFFISNFQHLARPTAVIGTGVGLLVAGTLLGLLLPRVRRWLGGRTELAAAVLALPLYLVAVLTFRPQPGDVGRFLYAIVLLPIFGAAVWLGVQAFRRVARGRVERDTDVARREVVRAMWIGGAAFLVGWANLGRLVFRRPDPGNTALPVRASISPAVKPSAAPGDASFARIPGLSPEITPNRTFYVVNEEIFPPDVDPATWRLEIGGLVDTPVSLTYRELTSLPAIEQYMTLECISNRTGGHLISTAKWTGVRLRDLLRRAGVKPGAIEVVSTSVDGFADSVPVADAMSPNTIIAYGMNGTMLPRAHGFPARILVPGYYGMKQPKWLGSIQIVDQPFNGFWEVRGWIKEAVVRTMSRIDTPKNHSTVDGSVVVAGVAFAGDRGISRVEVSVDGGQTFADAELKTALSAFTWRQWKYRFVPKPGSDTKLVVRATDGRGATQTSEVTPPEYSGSTGWHGVEVVDESS